MNRRALLVGSFLLAYLLSYFFRSTNAVLADDLQRDAGLGPEALGVMTSLFFAVFAAAQLPLGSALDRWGPRFVPAILMLAAVAGSLITAGANDFTGLALGRALIGLGMAGVLMGALKAFSAWFEARRFATISSVFVGVGSLGALGATTPLALLADSIGWRGVFTAAAWVTAALALLLMLVVRARPPAPIQPLKTTSTATPAANTHPTPTTGFGEIFRSAPFWRLAIAVFATYGSLFAMQGLWGGPFMTRGLGLPLTTAANLLLVLGASSTLGFLVAGPLADRFGSERMLRLGALAGALALATLALLSPNAAHPLLLAPLWGVFGVTAGMAVLGYAAARERFPHAAGRAVTAANVFGIGGSAVLQGGLGWVIAQAAVALGESAAEPPLAAYRAALLLCVLLMLLGALALSRRRA